MMSLKPLKTGLEAFAGGEVALGCELQLERRDLT